MNPCETKWQQKWLGLEVTHPAVQEVATEAEKFCGRWFSNNRSKSLFVLVGDTGTCKTHIAEAVFKFCRAAAMKAFDSGKHGETVIPSALFIPWPQTVAKFGDKQVANQIVDDAISCTLRIIDDIGAGTDPWQDANDRLCQILSRVEDKFTVVTTNVDVSEWAAKFGIRISDRLLRNSVVKSLRGVPSYAMWKRTQRKP